jgi:hypothetical protein
MLIGRTKPDAVAHFQQIFGRLGKKLMFLVFICGGPPPRITEFLDTIHLVNTLDRTRCVFWYHDCMLFLQSKSKSFYQVGYRPIARFMTPVLSKLLFWYFYLLKPANHLISNTPQYGPQSQTLEAWSSGPSMTYEIMRTALNSGLSRLSSNLNCRIYRHVAKILCEQRLSFIQQQADNMRSIRAFLSYQFGHTLQVFDIDCRHLKMCTGMPKM